MALLDEINQQLINKILRAQQKYKFFMLVLRIIMRLVGGRGGDNTIVDLIQCG